MTDLGLRLIISDADYDDQLTATVVNDVEEKLGEIFKADRIEVEEEPADD